MRSTLQSLALALLLGLGTAAHAATPAKDATQAIHDIRGFLPDLRFTLEGVGGTMTQKALEGNVVLLYFGYASCPDVCPTTLAELAQVMKNLGAEAAAARIVFVSVDPHRDTPAKLQDYVDVFYQGAIGLTGTESQIADVARRYRVAYQIEKPTTADKNDYVVSHSRGVYVFDQHGHARLLASGTETIAALTRGVRHIIEHPAGH